MDFPMDGPTWPVWGWWTRASKINGAMVAAKNAGWRSKHGGLLYMWCIYIYLWYVIIIHVVYMRLSYKLAIIYGLLLILVVDDISLQSCGLLLLIYDM